MIDTNNKGVSAARNKGLLKSKGKYAFQIDADDWLESDGLEELYKVAEREKADIVIANPYNNNKGVLNQIIDGKDLSNNLIKDFLTRKIKSSVCTKLYRRILFINNDIYYFDQVRIGEDLLINFLLVFYSRKIVRIEKSFLHYVKRNGSISNSYTDEILDLNIVFDFIEDFLIEKEIYSIYKAEFLYLKFYHIYFRGVFKSYNTGHIHKEIYQQYKSEKYLYERNIYISTFLKKQKLFNTIIIKLYEKNYYIGLCFKKMIYKLQI